MRFSLPCGEVVCATSQLLAMALAANVAVKGVAA
jgi:hypothetical protein